MSHLYRNKPAPMRTKFPRGVVTNHTTGNIGLFYACYALTLRGWNVMPTARNARGIDIVAYSQNAARTALVQVKTLSRMRPVGLGASADSSIGDFIVICVRDYPNEPKCFVMKPSEVRKLARHYKKGGKTSCWLPVSSYDNSKYRGRWERIGSGVP
jgi:hypothetical protein